MYSAPRSSLCPYQPERRYLGVGVFSCFAERPVGKEPGGIPAMRGACPAQVGGPVIQPEPVSPEKEGGVDSSNELQLPDGSVVSKI